VIRLGENPARIFLRKDLFRILTGLVCCAVKRDRSDGYVAFPDCMDIGTFFCILDKRPVDPEIGTSPGVKTFLNAGMEKFVGKAGYFIPSLYL
jgi:hypothetical protein